MRIAILGAGPAGMLAAHACALHGHNNFDILTIARRSPLFGCQYLHEEIPGITVPQAPVSYTLEGTPEDYRRKVYGDVSVMSTSPEDLAENHTAWDIRYAYDLLWQMYVNRLMHTVFNADMLDNLVQDGYYDLIISTIPRSVWVREQDSVNFISQEVWAVGDAPERGQAVPFGPRQDFTIICDGTSDVGWYRMAKVFGYTTIEWPGDRKPPIPNVSKVRKPIASNAPEIEGVLFVGRYGKWAKGVLTSDAFNDVDRYLTDHSD